MDSKCNICSSHEINTVYDGLIRSGGVGSEFVNGYKILECNACKINFLYPLPENIFGFYESDEYRKLYDYTSDDKELAKKYDVEQNDRIQKIGIEKFRGKVVADYGCGAGFFLDVVKGVSQRTIGIEPMKECAKILKEKDHGYYEYPEKLPHDCLDVAVCFDVLEHIENPLQFLKFIHKSLKTGGILYVSLPNKNDVLMNTNKEIFQKFFYCKAHLYYYDMHTLSYVLEKAGFQIIEKSGIHKYDFFNFINWLKADRPCGRERLNFIDTFFELLYKNELIRLNISSHLFFTIVKS